MNIDRYMVNLFFEIKRNVPLSQQNNMKISNPDIGLVMTELYKTTQDQNIKLLVGIFLERAGDDWRDKASKKERPLIQRLVAPKNSVDSKQHTISAEMDQKKKSQRIYRGQVVED